MIGVGLSIIPMHKLAIELLQEARCPVCKEELYSFVFMKNTIYECSNCCHIFSSLNNEKYILPSTDDTFFNYEKVLIELLEMVKQCG